MKLSLIVATLGENPPALARLLDSLAAQQDQRFETIVVDQGRGDAVRRLCARPKTIHVRNEPGLSRARNAGLRAASGDVVGFPDNDVTYPPDLVGSVLEVLARRPDLDGVTIQTVTPDGLLLNRRTPTHVRLMDRRSAWTQARSVGMFVRTDAVRLVGGFDERLGLGSQTPWAGGEDVDLAIRLVDEGKQVLHQPHIQIVHPDPGTMDRRERVRKGYAYSMSQGWRLRAHGYPRRIAVEMIARGLAGLLLVIVRGEWHDVAYRWAVIRGRVRGYFSAGSPTPWEADRS